MPLGTGLCFVLSPFLALLFCLKAKMRQAVLVLPELHRVRTCFYVDWETPLTKKDDIF